MDLITPTTELDAVNAMLSIIGEAPVNTLEGAVTADVHMATGILSSVCKETQSIGGRHNTELEYPLVPDSTGIITVPSNTVRVVLNRSDDPDEAIVLRGSRLYDRKRHSNVFTKSYKATLVVLLAFEELPETVRRFIVIRASRLFQKRTLGSEAVESFTQEEEYRARAVMLSEEDSTDPQNILDTPGFRTGIERP